MDNIAVPCTRIALHCSEAGKPSACLAELEFDRLILDASSPTLSQLLQQAATLIAAGKSVELRHGEQSLFMLAALQAAQLSYHPDAFIIGHGESLLSALVQAKRQHGDVSLHDHTTDLTATLQFNKLCTLIRALRNHDYVSHGEHTHHYWFQRRHHARVASLTFKQGANQSVWLISQGTAQPQPASLLTSQRLMLVISAEQLPALQQKLAQLQQEIEQTACILGLMYNYLRAHQAYHQYAAVIQASSKTAVQSEIKSLLKALPALFEQGQGHYKTPAGSYFTLAPLGQAALTFVYPGVGTIYTNMGHQLHRYFPEQYRAVTRQTDLAKLLQAEHVYPSASSKHPDMTVATMAISGVGFSYLLTQILTQAFKLTPRFALGYSMGEAAMWASLGVWHEPHTLVDATTNSPIFSEQISGALTAVKNAWQTTEEINWNSFVVRISATDINQLLPQFPRVYLAIVHGDSCIIAGCEHQCQQLLTYLGKRGIPTHLVTAMHTPPAKPLQQQLAEFYYQPVTSSGHVTSIQFISAADYQVVDATVSGLPTAQAIAQSIAKTFVEPLDFSRLVRSARHQGARLFIEVGADRQTTTLIDKINLGDNPTKHCYAVALNSKGGDDVNQLLTAIAALISHRTELSLTPLISGLQHQLARLQPNRKNGNPQSPNSLVEGEPS